MPGRRRALGLWLLAVVLCGLVALHAPLRTDMAAFLPRSASIAQRALTDQVNSGGASHLILVAIAGAPPQLLAAVSLGLASRLRTQPAFIDVANGDDKSFAKIQNFVWRNRYLLSNTVTADEFSVTGLHNALENDVGLLGSDLGVLLQNSLPSDPTGEGLTLMRQLADGPGPQSRDGVWFSRDGNRALLLLHTAAAGFDIEGQQKALSVLNAAFGQARATVPGAARVQLRETGPGVFAVSIRDTTKHDVKRLSVLASAGAACLLLFAYRSPRILLLGLLPVASGVLAAMAAVALDFGFLHGVTLGFGVTLIGESLDYPIYLFTQTRRGEQAGDTLTRIWPTLRLGAMTSVVGFGAMLFSNFVGFAQLGLFSIVGLVTAACVTRFVLPYLLPKGFFAPGADVLATPILAVMHHRGWVRLSIVVLVLTSGLALMTRHRPLLDSDLGDLSPIPAADQALDGSLRRDLGMSDLRYLIVFRATDEQQALETSEALATMLRGQQAQHRLASFDAPSSILPSDMTQRQRQAALPKPDLLRTRFSEASSSLPFRLDTFEPFFTDVAKARTAPLLTQSSLPSGLALRLQSMLMHDGNGWTVMAPLTGVANPSFLAASLAMAHLHGAQLIDLQQQSHKLLRTFQQDASLLASIGSIAIIIVLAIGLRSLRRVLAVVAPLAAAIVVTAALLTMDGGTLSIFMIVGFLLVIAVASNYCLFLNRQAPDYESRRRAVASIVLANLCTVSAYGLMTLSRLPVLHDIGKTVAIGTVLSLLFAAAITTSDLATVLSGPASSLSDIVISRHEAAAGRQGRVLLIMLPGAGIEASEFADRGMVAAVHQRGLAVDIVAARLDLDLYLDGDVAAALHRAVVEPALAMGYSRLWLLGISLGGMGALLYASHYARGVEGLVLLAPFLGTQGTVAEILASGGITAWSTAGSNATASERRILTWLQEFIALRPTLPALYLGYGCTDRFARGHELLGDHLPEHVIVSRDGGHDWPTWLDLWGRVLDLAPFSDLGASC